MALDLSLKKLNELIDNLSKALTAINVLSSSQQDGLMSKDDKAKLDTIDKYANKYELKPASRLTLGGVMQGTNITIDGNGYISANIHQITKGVNNFSGNSAEKSIPHGLTQAPTTVQITPTTKNDGAVGAYWVTWDDQKIYVGNTGESTSQFTWLAIV